MPVRVAIAQLALLFFLPGLFLPGCLWNCATPKDPLPPTSQSPRPDSSVAPQPPSGELRLDFKEGVIDLVALPNDSTERPSAEIPVLIVFDPLLFDPAVLVERKDALASWFARRDFIVYVGRNLSHRGDVFDLQPAMIAPVVERVRRAHTDSHIFLVGIGPGGRPLLSYAAQSHAGTGSRSSVSGMILIGTGLDYTVSPLLSKYPALPGSDLRDVCTPGHPCYPFVRPDVDRRGFRLRRFPDIHATATVPGSERPTEPWIERLESLDLPILLITGGRDEFTPPASTLALRQRYGQKSNCAFSARIEDCSVHIEASRQAGLDTDYDLFDLVLSENAPDEIFRPIRRWMDGKGRSNP